LLSVFQRLMSRW